MPNRKRFFPLVLVVALALAPAAFAGDWWKDSDAGSSLDRRVINKDSHDAYRINWVDEYIEVMAGATVDAKRTANMAHAESMAKKTARHLAYEKLAETISGIRISSDATYDRELMLDSNVKTSVQAIIRGAIVVGESVDTYPDGSVWAEVVLGVHLQGDKGIGGPLTRTVLQREDTTRYYQETAVESEATDPKFREKFTGLIIDARGLDAGPAVFPKIVTAAGNVLYGPGTLDEKTLATQGLLQYAVSVEEAKKLERTGKKPLVIEAVAVAGEGRSDLVVSDDAAALIHATIKEGKLGHRGAVVFVID